MHFLCQVAACFNALIALGDNPEAMENNVFEVTIAHKNLNIYQEVVIREAINGNIGTQTSGSIPFAQVFFWRFA